MKDKKMRIGFLCFSLAAGGAERNAIYIAHYLNKKNCTVELILIKNVNDYSKKIPYFTRKLPVISLLPNEKFPFYLYPQKLLEVLIKLFVITKKRKYHLLVAAAEYYGYYFSLLISKLTGTKNILIYGNNLFIELSYFTVIKRVIHNLLLRLSFHFADHIVCMSDGLVEDLKKNFSIKAQKITRVYNGAEEKINNSRIYDNNLIVTFGRLVIKKGFYHLIKAFQQVVSEYPEKRLLIIGKGPLRMSLKNLIKEFRLEKNVKLIGDVLNPRIYIKRAAIFVFPSLYEGFGNVVIEAMSYGVPIISTNCLYGPKEILDNSSDYSQITKTICYSKYGLLVPTFPKQTYSLSLSTEEKLIAQAIIKMVESKKLQKKYSKQSRFRAKIFPAEKMAIGYYNVFRKVLK